MRWRPLVRPPGLGTFIGMGVVLAVSILVWNGPNPIHRLAVVTIVVGLPGLFFTYTRGLRSSAATIVAVSLSSSPAERVPGSSGSPFSLRGSPLGHLGCFSGAGSRAPPCL